MLLLVLAKKTFTQGGKPNAWHLSDTGCATGFLILEAERRGITAHPMAGFDRQAARDAFSIAEDFEVVEVIALGYPGDPEVLSAKNRERNRPQPRMQIEELLA
jgi:nitroreductase